MSESTPLSFDDLGKEMPAPGFRTPPRVVNMPEPSASFDWGLAGWRILLVAVITLTHLVYFSCGLLNGLHAALIRARTYTEGAIARLENPIPEEVV